MLFLKPGSTYSKTGGPPNGDVTLARVPPVSFRLIMFGEALEYGGQLLAGFPEVGDGDEAPFAMLLLMDGSLAVMKFPQIAKRRNVSL